MERMHREIIVVALAGEATEEELRRLQAWRAADPENEDTYRRLRRVWHGLDGLAPVTAWRPRPDADELVQIAEFRTAAAREVPRGLQGTPSLRPWYRRMAVPVAASLVLGIGLGVLGGEWSRDRTFGPNGLVTGVNEVATVTLDDETVVRLAPETRLTFPEDGAAREVFLQGRAYFAVSRRTGDPFTVRSAGGDLEVLGTRFDVESRDGGLQVAVVEGTVRMSAQGRQVNVAANQVARAAVRRAPEVERVGDVFEVIDWLGRFLAFESTPLDQVAEEFERRFGLRIEVADSALMRRTVTGWFADQSPQEMITGICRAVDARCTLSDHTVRMEAFQEARTRGPGAVTGEL